ncbi:MAG: response regulator transcription factor [Gammaproteobacteria bacterium]|nr:response regulator transcription factor [Gammaproteobacteria bacterium]
MKTVTVLIADDEARIRGLLSQFFQKKLGYKVVEAEDGEEALEIFLSGKPKINLVILDVMMPKLSGWQVLEKIKESSNVPVVMLTAKAEEESQLKGFKLGADDYVTKPFSPNVLLARCEKLIQKEKEEKVLEFGIIKIDTLARTALINGEEVQLTPKEYELLIYFIENKGIALSRQQILNSVWNYDYYGDLRTVDTHVKQLRNKIKDASQYITTVRGFGYKLDPRFENAN